MDESERQVTNWRSDAVSIRQALGVTTVHLPLGGVASTDPAGVRPPLIRPFWLLAGAAAAAVVSFVGLRLGLQ